MELYKDLSCAKKKGKERKKEIQIHTSHTAYTSEYVYVHITNKQTKMKSLLKNG